MTILSGKVARDHVHVFISIEGIKISMVEDDQLASTPSGVAALAKGVLGQALWARGYLAVTSGTITDEMVQEYIKGQEVEPIQSISS